MKTKNNTLKLILKKQTISNLNSMEMGVIKGGTVGERSGSGCASICPDSFCVCPDHWESSACPSHAC